MEGRKKKKKRLYVFVIYLLIAVALITAATVAWFSQRKESDIQAVEARIEGGSLIATSFYKSKLWDAEIDQYHDPNSWLPTYGNSVNDKFEWFRARKWAKNDAVSKNGGIKVEDFHPGQQNLNEVVLNNIPLSGEYDFMFKNITCSSSVSRDDALSCIKVYTTAEFNNTGELIKSSVTTKSLKEIKDNGGLVFAMPALTSESLPVNIYFDIFIDGKTDDESLESVYDELKENGVSFSIGSIKVDIAQD
ncbi:MAG: hypothetical protein K6F09_08970 [Clostridiales bacterium]|nr:hypothetical protein [Clostridiales bacterium]